ncbi:MOSC domain-containing protein [Microbispora sp. RL4-1S]|uniref:MOSC domain-containing protein n=1 Tax=Microbispora oryzae TaxID=2806554 RepID=A0A940WRF8_9ACTN|nr:MOSC N-terminal beta barrel domain-containing protein [Microbispora oryzae]MBP2705711.1 MOSC domain-containing protein [Microbispora oryzae]
MRLTDIRIYPLKSAAGLPVETALVHPWGLDGDRRWAVVDEQGDNLWLGEFPAMLTVRAENLADGGLSLSAPGLPGIVVPPAGGRSVPVGFSGLDSAVAAEPAADEWFTRLLGRTARLVWLDDPRRRTIDPAHGGLPGEVVSFAWDAPLLLTSTASLRLLDDWIAQGAAERGEEPPGPLSMARFRPSVVIDGAEPYQEDDWKEVRIGTIDFRVSEICDRCAVTTIDPETAVKGKEPIRTLARHRRWDGKTWFGIRLVPRAPGRISVGDPVVPVS